MYIFLLVKIFQFIIENKKSQVCRIKLDFLKLKIDLYLSILNILVINSISYFYMNYFNSFIKLCPIHENTKNHLSICFRKRGLSFEFKITLFVAIH